MANKFKNTFESELVKKINLYFEKNLKVGFAYRLKQSMFNSQYADVLIDSLINYAVECKQITGEHFYFKTNFRQDQIIKFSEFLKKTNRGGILAIRKKIVNFYEYYLIPWQKIEIMINQGYKRIDKEVLYTCKQNIDEFTNWSL